MTTIVTRASKGSALSWTDGDNNLINLNTAKIENVVEDLTPQLGGNLDVNGNSIVSASNGNIAITPNGTGSIVLDGLNWPQADGTADYVLKTNGSGQLSWTAMSAGGGDVVNDTTPQLGGDLDVNGYAITTTALTIPIELKSNYIKIGESSATGTSWLTTAGAQNLYLGPQDISYSHILIAKNANGNITIAPDGTGKVIIDGLSWPTADGTANYVLKTDGAGNLGWVAPTSGTVTSVGGTGTVSGLTLTGTVTSSGNLTLGGTLSLVSPGAIGSTTASTGAFTTLSASTSASLKAITEGALYDIGTAGGTQAPNVANGNVQKITLNSALTINAFTSPVAGQSLTLIIYGGTAYTSITSTMKFAGGIKTLTGTAGCIDILSVYYDGTNYFASLGKGFA